MYETRYPNTTANHHMTSNVSKAQGTHPYFGQESVMVGNGEGLPITTVGNFQVPSINVTLNNVLIVLAIKKNLLYVSWFTEDHNCYFLFYPWGFLLKDLKT